MDSEYLSVYMQDSLTIDTEIEVLGIEETGEEMYLTKNEKNYIQLLPLYMVEEIAQGGMDGGYSSAEIAARILEYSINDA